MEVQGKDGDDPPMGSRQSEDAVSHTTGGTTTSFLDFRTPQAGAMRFFFVLPFTTQRALVEYVACTTTPSNRAFMGRYQAA